MVRPILTSTATKPQSPTTHARMLFATRRFVGGPSLPWGVIARLSPWLMLAVWCGFVAVTLQTYGLFTVLGFDYGVLWTAARAFAQHPADAYDRSALTAGIQSLGAFARHESTSLVALPAPYPPIFFLALAPLAALAAPLSLGLWTLLNLGL